ncbi:hypothetical protein [Streptomyces hoynatensis]|uniref:Uncharacterized protein n=1 Tax=Streptomyces hoynatensis TaxID=1141874 RepID=A0A3A9YZL6_9ACTN|nr:hypothetical protein [Streptomyces hoynatensis]RKN41189.1 hypothetical protein D7294_15780 [Streptomyces hoynatensis]
MSYAQVQGRDVNGRTLVLGAESEVLARMLLTQVSPLRPRDPEAALNCPYCDHSPTVAEEGGGWSCPHCGAESS